MLMVNEVLISIELLWGTKEKEKHRRRKKTPNGKGRVTNTVNYWKDEHTTHSAARND